VSFRVVRHSASSARMAARYSLIAVA
jgi:hypothetical protein